jgi:antitoxin CptB
VQVFSTCYKFRILVARAGLMLERSIIKWRCRRGMLELDVFLIAFFDNQYPFLDSDDKKIFTELLEEDDVDLFQWLMAYRQSENIGFNRVIKQIRDYRLGK